MLLLTVMTAVAVASGLIGWFVRGRRTPAAAITPAVSPQQRKLLGFDTPGDQRVSIQVRDWNALKLAAWRSRVGWEVATRAALDVVDRCAHAAGCPGKGSETEPCLPECADREVRMSALVVLSAARQLAPVDARKPADQPYFAPSRERYSEVMAELAAAQAELDVLRAGANRGVLDAIEKALRTAPQPEAPDREKDTYADLLAANDATNEAEVEENAEAEG